MPLLALSPIWIGAILLIAWLAWSDISANLRAHFRNAHPTFTGLICGSLPSLSLCCCSSSVILFDAKRLPHVSMKLVIDGSDVFAILHMSLASCLTNELSSSCLALAPLIRKRKSADHPNTPTDV